MITGVRTPYVAEPLGLVMRRGMENQEDGASFASALETAGAGGPRQVSASTANSQQAAGNPAPGPVVPPGPELERLPPIAADRTGRRFTALDDPTAKVQAELAKLGIDPSTVRFERWDDDIATIGGAHTNHLLRAYLPGGRYEDYSIEWTLRSPQVTAVDIQRLMGVTSRPLYT